MKRLVPVLLVTLAPLLFADSGTMTPSEREYLVAQLEKSKADMLASIDGLTTAQWKFKPAPNVWSVQECAEHLVKTEGMLFGMAQKSLSEPAVERLATANEEQDHKLVAMMQDRSQKGKAPEPLVPSGMFATPADAAEAFKAARDKSIAYVKTTDDPLRTHVIKGFPWGDVDAYQVLLLMASHTERHTAQIKEVEANPNCPKSAAGLRAPALRNQPAAAN
jgi:hypothetical protein